MKISYWIIAIVVGAIGAAMLLSNQQPTQNIITGGVGSVYAYKNITSANGSAATGVKIRTGAGELGRVIINTKATAGDIRIYDGNTSTTTGTLIGRINATTTAFGPTTLFYDVAVTKGVILDIPTTFNGDYTFATN